jgi:pSer/pThr/pTyr-binding forkhead associated (FHA) protein
MEVTLTVHSLDGASEVPLNEARLTFGRTSDADVVIDDSSLSRVHASVNREGDRVWIIDEGSTNGSSVNGKPVPLEGTPLNDGDEIYIGNTTIVVSFNLNGQSGLTPETPGVPIAPTSKTLPMPLIAGVGVIVIFCAVLVIGLAYRSIGGDEKITVKKYSTANDTDSTLSTSPNSAQNSAQPNSTSPPSESETTTDSTADSSAVPTRQYAAMTAEEQRQFIAAEAQHVARMIGNREGYAFTPEVVSKIKVWVDAYARRLRSPKPAGGCNMRHDLNTLLNRARTYAPVVVKSFNEKGLAPQVGIYLAMIEAEYCPCLSSGTGPKGFFQFASSTARRYGVRDVSHWTDRRPDDRCKIDIMAPVAAQYMKDLIAMFGTGPLSVPLAVASYNSGEGGLNQNLMTALNSTRTSANPERSFWTMVAHEEQLSDQFQRENIKYVPHFFAAAIVGENPRVFGVDILPISSYASQSGTAVTADER